MSLLDRGAKSALRAWKGVAAEALEPAVGKKAPTYIQQAFTGMGGGAYRMQAAEEVVEDAGRASRIRRRDVNRLKQLQGHLPNARYDDLGEETQGLTSIFPISPLRDDLDQVTGSAYRLPDPLEASLFHRFGKYEEVPLHSLATAQDDFSYERLQEILGDPSLAKHPRLGHERPLVMRVTPPKNVLDMDLENLDISPFHKYAIPQPGVPQDILWQGNHRATAAFAQNQMFMPAQVWDVDEIAARNVGAEINTMRVRAEEKWERPRTHHNSANERRLAIRRAMARRTESIAPTLYKKSKGRHAASRGGR